MKLHPLTVDVFRSSKPPQVFQEDGIPFVLTHEGDQMRIISDILTHHPGAFRGDKDLRYLLNHIKNIFYLYSLKGWQVPLWFQEKYVFVKP